MADTPARLLQLLSLLQTPREWPGPELARRLGVTTRTVRNDIERLRDLGYPVDATRGSVGGYRLVAGTAMPPLLLDDDEAVAIAVSLRTAAGGAVQGIEETALRALTKLQQVLPKRLGHRVDALHMFTVSVPAKGGPLVDGAALALMAGAARDRERIRFGYQAHSGEVTQRRVEPHRLVNWGRRWYLVGWDVDRQDWRTFRADRISELSGSGLRFSLRDLPAEDIAEYVSRGARQARATFRGHLLVQAPASRMAEKLAYSLAMIEPVDDDSCRVEIGADSAQMMANWLGFLDAPFEVLGPPELAEAVQAMSQRFGAAAPSADR
jgi:predicted DNA-binding transcriptional regulator YafY